MTGQLGFGTIVAGDLLITRTVTIPSGQSVSSAIDFVNTKLVGIIYPAAWTAAGLTFSASPDGTAFANLYDGATERNLTVTAGVLDARPLGDWLAVRSLVLRSGTSATPVAQAADRTFTLIMAP